MPEEVVEPSNEVSPVENEPPHDEAKEAAAKEQKPASKAVFSPPEGFQPPEGADAPGKEFDMVCTLKVEEDGRLCIVKLGDQDMPGYDDDEEDGRHGRPSYKKYAQGIMSQMNAE